MNLSEQIFNDLKSLETKLGLPVDFYKNLLYDSDWSFVIKISAMFEAAATHALTERLGHPNLLKSFSFLEYANGRYGKIKLLKDLNIITKEQAAVLTKLAELRNRFAHDVSNVNMTLKMYIDELSDKNQREAFVSWAGLGINQDPILFEEGHSVTKKDLVLQNPKFAIWVTSAEILACIYLDVALSSHRNELPIYQMLIGFFNLSPINNKE